MPWLTFSFYHDNLDRSRVQNCSDWPLTQWHPDPLPTPAPADLPREPQNSEHLNTSHSTHTISSTVSPKRHRWKYPEILQACTPLAPDDLSLYPWCRALRNHSCLLFFGGLSREPSVQRSLGLLWPMLTSSSAILPRQPQHKAPSDPNPC